MPVKRPRSPKSPKAAAAIADREIAQAPKEAIDRLKKAARTGTSKDALASTRIAPELEHTIHDSGFNAPAPPRMKETAPLAQAYGKSAVPLRQKAVPKAVRKDVLKAVPKAAPKAVPKRGKDNSFRDYQRSQDKRQLPDLGGGENGAAPSTAMLRKLPVPRASKRRKIGT